MGVYAKINLRTVVGEDEWCIDLAEDNLLWQALVLGVLNIGFLYECLLLFQYFWG